MMGQNRWWLVALVLAAAMVIGAPTAMAEESISVEVRTIVATPEGDEIDDELRDMENRLRQGITNYSSFRQINRQRLTVERDEPGEFELPTDDELIIRYTGREGDFVKLGLALGSRLDTTLRASPGSTFFQAGLRYDDGLLVLAITVE